MVFGLVVAVASWRIERLENLGINPWSIPGLLPAVVGLLIVLLAVALAWQSRHPAVPEEAAAPAEAAPAAAAGREWGRTLVAAAMCVLFAGVSLGRGLSFVAEAATFIFLFTSVFSWSQWRAEARVLRSLATTLVTAIVASLLISWLFESVFLVRLP
jgi:hypothetical protein